VRSSLTLLHDLRDVRDKRLTPQHRLLLAMMIAFRNGEGAHVRFERRGASDPSVAQLAASAGLSPRHVRRLLAQIRAYGYLEVRHPATFDTAVVYNLVLPSRGATGDIRDDHDSPDARVTPDAEGSTGVTPTPATGDANDRSAVTPMSASADRSADRSADHAADRARARAGRSETNADANGLTSPASRPPELRHVIVDEYVEAIRAAKEGIGRPSSFALSTNFRERMSLAEILVAALHGHALSYDGRKLYGSEAIDWMRAAVEAFVRDGDVAKNPSVYSSYAPRGFLKWLNEDRYRARAPIRPAPVAPAEVRTPAQCCADAERLMQLLDGIAGDEPTRAAGGAQ
jgi:hypothetical protein